MSTSSTFSSSSGSNHCPTHKSAPVPRTCPICAAWADLEKERKRLALSQERLDLDVQLFKAEKKNHRRMAFLQAQQADQQRQQQEEQQQLITQQEEKEQLARQLAQQQEQLAQQRALQEEQEQQSIRFKEAAEQREQELQRNWEKTVNQLKGHYETDIEQWKLKYQQEQEDNKIQILEWKLKFQKQDADIQQGQQDVLDHKGELEQLRKQHQDLLQQQQKQQPPHEQRALEREREADRAKQLKEVQQQLQKQQKINAVQLKEAAKQTDELNSLRDQVLRMNILLAQYSSDRDRSQEDVKELQEKLEDAMIENKRYAMHIEELEEKSKTLEEQPGNVVPSHRQHRSDDEDDDDDVYVNEPIAKRDCPNCEDLEEDLYELKLKLNKLQISSQKEIDGLKEQLQTKMTTTAATPLGDENVIGKLVGSKAGKEQQAFRKSETEKKKGDMKMLAFAAKEELSKREKRALEQELEEAKRNTHLLALELEQLHHEREQEGADPAATRLDREQLTDLMRQVDQQQQTQDAYATRHKMNALRALEQELEEATKNTHLLALELEQLKNERKLKRADSSVTRLDREQLMDLKRQIDQLQQTQDAYAARHKKNAQEWNGITESLGQKQRHVFDSILPQVDYTIQELEQQINELEKAGLPGWPNTADNSVGQASGRRNALLAEVDSSNNRHVLEFNYESEYFQGKYTGFLNTMSQPEGHGVLLGNNHDVYEGEWKNGKLHGRGVYAACEGDLYVGQWFKGEHHGQGVSVFSEGKLCVGEYNMGRLEGQGITVWPHGDKYKGSYANDMRNGQGELLYADGRVYQGEYVDDRRHGYGVEISRDGRVLYDGFWAYGEFVGDGGDSGSVVASIADPGEH